MKDRAMQALYALAVVPVAETTGDLNSYGFRDGRCCADAIKQCYNCLAKCRSARWILEADIQACFDRIDHEWMLTNILIDKNDQSGHAPRSNYISGARQYGLGWIGICH
jgi:RNA-directed DNA polymerase